MSQTKRFVLLAGAALSLGGVNAALAQQAQNSDEIRATVAEMLADAQNRSSLLAGGGTGHDGMFYLADSTGNFRLNVSGQIQFRYYLGFRDQDNTSGIDGGDEFTTGFQTANTRLAFHGNIINPNWTYAVEGNFARDGGAFSLEDAYVGYNFGNGFKARWGQFKLPFLREELVDDRYQLAVDRSVANEFFNQDWSQGIETRWEQDAWRLMVAFSDGFGSRNSDYPNTNVQPGGAFGQADYAFTGRFEFKFAGMWEDFEDFTAQQGQKFGCLLGVAAHYQVGTNTESPIDTDLSYLGYTADISLEGDSWNLYGAFLGRHLDGRASVISGGGDVADEDDFGIVLQGGFRFSKGTEVFARWDSVFIDEDVVTSGEDTFNFITVGLNQYYASHAAKGTIDFVYCFDDTSNLSAFNPLTGTGFPNSGLGLLGDSEEGEIAIRFQFQLLF